MSRLETLIPDATSDEPQTNLQRFLTNLPTDSLASKLAIAHLNTDGSAKALHDVLDGRLTELREAYDTVAAQAD